MIAFIPARGGSKGLSKKNTRILLDKPLIKYTIDAAKDSGVFDRIIVTSDCPEILKIASESSIEALKRPSKLASDKALTVDAIAYHIEAESLLDYDYVCLLQPTSPLRSSEHIIKGYNACKGRDCNSLISVQKVLGVPQKYLKLDTLKNRLEPLLGLEYLEMPRQSLEQTYKIDGSLYMTKISQLMSQKKFVIPRIEYILGGLGESIDIDTLDDFKQAELFLQSRH